MTKKSKDSRPPREPFDRVSTGVVLEQVRAMDEANPDRFGKPLTDGEYASKMAFEERRAAILDEARARGIGFGLSDCAATDLDALAEKFGCVEPWLRGEIPGRTYDIPVTKSSLTSHLRDEPSVFRNPGAMTPEERAAARSNDERRAALLADADARDIPLGLTEVLMRDLDALEAIIRTRNPRTS